MKFLKIGEEQIEIPVAIVGSCDTCKTDASVFDFSEVCEDGDVIYECETGCGTMWPIKFGIVNNG